MIFYPSDRVRLVMIHVAGRNDQYWLLVLSDDIGERQSQLLKHLEPTSTQSNGNKSQLGLKRLQEWKFDLGCMLRAMCRRIFLESGEAPFQLTREIVMI